MSWLFAMSMSKCVTLKEKIIYIPPPWGKDYLNMGKSINIYQNMEASIKKLKEKNINLIFSYLILLWKIWKKKINIIKINLKLIYFQII